MAPSRAIAELLAWLAVLIVVGFGLGEISGHVTNTADLAAVRELATLRTGGLTSLARVLSVLGRTVIIAPLALLAFALLIHSGRRGDAVFIAVSTLGALILLNVDKATV